MDIELRGETGLTTRKKKRNKEEKKSIFDIYRSEKTIKDYLFYLKDFLNYVYDGEGPIQQEEIIKLMSEIEKDDIDDYLAHLITERNLKKTSVNKIISSLKSLYKELEKNGYENPFRHIQLFKTSRDLENVLKLSYEDIKKILEKYPVYGDKSYRNTLILQTLFYTGMRSSELLNLKFKNLLKRDGEHYIKLEKTKSGKEQYKPMHNYLVEKVEKYKHYIINLFDVKPEEMDERYVFPSSFEKNTPISYRGLYSLIQEMGKIIDKNISPHNIRHAIATELSLNGADILEIRDFLGHSDTRVTEIYINAKSILEKRVLDKIPVPNLD
ncbi:MAG: tyrosine-type recombinase/integrase [Fusobacteriaceae bacterium]